MKTPTHASALRAFRPTLTSTVAFALASTLPCLALPVLDDTAWERRELAAGVELMEQTFENLFGAPQIVKILRVNLDEPTVKIRFAPSHPAQARKAPVPDFVPATGAIAAVNGGYSGGGRGGRESTNSGIFKIDGEVRPFQRQETEDFHFVGGAALGIDKEGNWHFRNRPGDTWPEDWPEVEHALAGAHRLIENGEPHPSITEFKTDIERRHASRRHPRTAIGIRPDRTALLVTVDGRHEGKSEGMTLEELAKFMSSLGCIDAINFDGGGSTTMWLRGEGVINYPTDNRQFDHEGARRVFSAVVILPNPPAEADGKGRSRDDD
jgi:hypothetical protein